MNRRWATLLGLVVAGIALVPLATAGAQAPPTSASETPTAPEGSIPPGGTVQCTTAATLDPTHGPPGTVVTVTTEFMGNCDDVNSIFLAGMTCVGQFVVPGQEGNSFEMTVDTNTGNATGTFTAPATEPDPPVVDAVEPITVTVTCQTLGGGSVSAPAAEGGNATTYEYPPATFDLELFADSDTDQPTLVDNDQVVDDGGVVAATPPFTG